MDGLLRLNHSHNWPYYEAAFISGHVGSMIGRRSHINKGRDQPEMGED